MRERSPLGRILVVDDEETFLEATADLLRTEGYECACAPDGIQARRLLETDSFDLLIADIKMPGNSDLELIRDLPEAARGMPAILATGYPSLQTAVSSVQLSVVAYLIKPVDFDEMLAAVQRAVGISRTYRTVLDAQTRNQNTLATIESVTAALQERRDAHLDAPVRSFVDITLSNILCGLQDLKRLTDENALECNQEAVRRREQDAQLEFVRVALGEAVSTLSRTRSSFKSKTLGELRHRLEVLLTDLA